MADKFLLYSMAEFKPIFEQAFIHKKPKKILEIGSEYGGSTKILLDYAKSNDAFVYVVDPYPYVDLEVVLKDYAGFYQHISQLSLEVLVEVSDIDLFVIDGDHNYYTVFNELSKIFANNPTAWVFLHDVGWPSGYRDQYYNPDNIPVEWRHDYTYDYGVDADNKLVRRGGFFGYGDFAIAKQYGGEKNGVKKAIEDYIGNHSDYFYNEIMPIMGLGLIVPMVDKAISIEIMKPYQNSLCEKMERNRIELYIRYLELERHLVNRVIRKLSKIFGKTSE